MPMIVVPQEQYNEMYRNVTSGVPVKVQLDVQNRFINTDLNAYNTLGDIRGSDKPDEYVMIGAHLDSWHYGNGATDNAAGSIVMMEAMRILRKSRPSPKTNHPDRLMERRGRGDLRLARMDHKTPRARPTNFCVSESGQWNRQDPRHMGSVECEGDTDIRAGSVAVQGSGSGRGAARKYGQHGPRVVR